MIAGKPLFEILTMYTTQRYRWYMTILPEEKQEIMGIVEAVRRVKMADRIISEETRTRISAAKKEHWKDPEYRDKMSGENSAKFGKSPSEATRAKLSAALMGHSCSEEARAKQSASIIGEKHWAYGKHFSEEHRAKISAARIEYYKDPQNIARISGENNVSKRPEVRAKISAAKKGKCTGEDSYWYGKTLPEEVRAKISARAKLRVGEKNANWRGGTSFEPYCPLFNNKIKEKIRNRDNRVCVLCGKGEIQNGQRLSVHHVDSDKMQGCNDKPWYLCALCRSCNSRPDTVEKEFLIVSGGHGG